MTEVYSDSMPRASVETTNPIRVIRLANHKTLESFAAECHIHLQAVYLNECGVYPSILPSILERLVKKYGSNRSDVVKQYADYVRTSREEFGLENSFHNYLPGDSDIRISPITKFRADFNLSRLGFAKRICCQPSGISRVERKITSTFPEQLQTALKDAGLPVGILQELLDRQVEFYYG